MSEYIRPISRVTAVELTNCEIENVSGAFNTHQTFHKNTDVYTNGPGDAWTYDGSKHDD